MGRDGKFIRGVGLDVSASGTQGRCGLLAKKLPASRGEKFPVEMNSPLLRKEDVPLLPQQTLQTHSPSGSQKSHTCQPITTELSWWKQEPMMDVDLNLNMNCPSGMWVENYQDLSSWCSSGEAASYLWPTTDESVSQTLDFQGEIDFDLRKSEEIASVPLQEDSWGAETEGSGNLSLTLPPIPEDRWGLMMGDASTEGSATQTSKPLEPVHVNDCWLLDVEHEEVVKNEAESGITIDFDPKNQIPLVPSTSITGTKPQHQLSLDRRNVLSNNVNLNVQVKVEAEEPLGSRTTTMSSKLPVSTSGKLWSEQKEHLRPQKPMYSFKKLEQREVQRNPSKTQVPQPKSLPVQRPKERPVSPDLFEEVHRKVVAMTAKSAAAAAAAVKKENVPVTTPAAPVNRVQRASFLPRLDLNIDPNLMDTETVPASSNGISTPEVLKSFGDMSNGFDLLSYLFDDKVMTPPIPLDSGKPKGKNPFHFTPQTSMGKPSIRDLPGFLTHNPTDRSNLSEDRKADIRVERPRFSKKIDMETASGDEDISEEKPKTSVVVEVQPQLLPSTNTFREEQEIQTGTKLAPPRRKRLDSALSDMPVRIDEPRTTRKKRLSYKREDEESIFDDDDDDDDDEEEEEEEDYMKDDEKDEDFTLGSAPKRRKRRTSESSTISKRARTTPAPSRRNQQVRRVSTSSESDRYRELRDRNNEASRRSRLTRKAKEQELMVREKELAKENQILKVKSEEMENLVKRLREALLQSMMKK